ncbi:MAG TPA: nucleotidyl transferase AbiEii/AbiGii toxin family protein [Burkholderiaceae bacterium]|nr:nucleotidyl transferase AbiEii/AbiGii toxin family protein [Burkholderiaceae bacterium]
MPDFFGLSREDRREALLVAAERSGRPLHLLEKDVWVVWALNHLFAGPHARHLVFKGGTSLSKAYGVVRRFSEDVDLTYDIRAIAPDLVGKSESPWPTSRSQEKRWSKAIRQRLAELVAGELLSGIAEALQAQGLPATARAEGEQIFIDYDALGQGTGYVRPSVLLEFGARSTGEPNEPKPVVCDAAAHLQDLSFPTATPQVMRAERTFWEKATAIHVFCAQGSFRGGARFARHWHDLIRLDQAGFADSAAADRELAKAVAAHKSIFFAESATDGGTIDYGAAVTGALVLVPTGDACTALADDYQRMVEDGLLMDDAEPFDTLLDRCQTLAHKVNAMVCEP